MKKDFFYEFRKIIVPILSLWTFIVTKIDTRQGHPIIWLGNNSYTILQKRINEKVKIEFPNFLSFIF